ncbi:hypothetical protein Indivirus_1_233 [Indivirus ILV1]|uniref:Uncharacterized protein n=1 Tax=Indivirus ILV1 TaxID=1977633 RepID=A0A1V0SD07_9VIRU|nr:hypothetical protein Indivirus_1_233 [Indivirus ILV1]
MSDHDKLASLEEAISYPPYKEIEGLTTITVNTFNYDSIKEKLHGQGMETIEGEKLVLIDEMIKLLDSNKIKYSVNNHNYIVFYWRGLPILVIKTEGNNKQTMMYIAVKTFKDESTKKAMTKLGSKIAFGTLGVIAASGLLFVYSYLNPFRD